MTASSAGAVPEGARSLTVGHAKESDLPAAYAFHRRHAGEHLWERSYEQFSALVEERQLFLATEGTAVVGICHTIDFGDRAEFGGVFVDDSLRGRGVAAALGRVAIATELLVDEDEEVTAYVNELNELPRGLLVDQLGFEGTGEKDEPRNPPPGVERNAEGKIVSDVFRFRRPALHEFADWFEGFDGTLHGRGDLATNLTLNADVWKHRGALLPALRELAGVPR